jgi:hypothetical protein
MKQRNLIGACALACALAFGMSGASAGTPSDPLLQAQELITTAPGVAVTVYMRGLNNPRGLKAGGYRGLLHIAEGGTGGTNSTAGRCDQIDPPVGPYTGSATGSRISAVYYNFSDPTFHVRITRFDNLPSSQTSPDSGSLVSGVADIAFIDGTTYALISGAGCSHGVASRDNAIVRMTSTGPVLVANLSAWLKTHPGSQLGPDVETDGTWYSMVAFNGALYVVEPNHGLFVRVNPTTGAISRILDVSAAVGQHVVPTALARHKGYFYIANLGTFPIVDGSQRVWRVLSNPPRLQAVARGTAILGLAFGSDDAMYILQMTSGAPEPTPGRGSIVRIRPGGAPQTIVDGLTLPTAMTMGRDGALYVSHIGFGPPIPGAGEVLRVQLPGSFAEARP